MLVLSRSRRSFLILKITQLRDPRLRVSVTSLLGVWVKRNFAGLCDIPSGYVYLAYPRAYFVPWGSEYSVA